jgi:riboflavin-specific deaminase-like protein
MDDLRDRAPGAWALLLAVRRAVDAGARPGRAWGFARDAEGRWSPAATAGAAECLVDGVAGTVARGPQGAPPSWRELVDLHLRHALCRRGAGHVVAVLGQSLDGFIATPCGHSRYINGAESLVHLHRLRALSDAVLIGVGTAVADAPRLTTRHVPGPDAIRVVVDPNGRLPHGSGLLHDGLAETIVLRSGERDRLGEARLTAQAVAIHLPASPAGLDPADILAALAGRGLTRVLVEGGGRTVARFLEAGRLDRLQLAVSPLILGGGRPALPIAPCARLEEARRPAASRRYLMGEDVLFDLALRPAAGEPFPAAAC